ncbi:hypothetical protein GCM10010424_73680 [Streptomyces lienomycini]
MGRAGWDVGGVEAGDGVFGAVDLHDGVAFEDRDAFRAVVGVQGDTGAAIEEGLAGEEDFGAGRLGDEGDGAGAAAAAEGGQLGRAQDRGLEGAKQDWSVGWWCTGFLQVRVVRWPGRSRRSWC